MSASVFRNLRPGLMLLSLFLVAVTVIIPVDQLIQSSLAQDDEEMEEGDFDIDPDDFEGMTGRERRQYIREETEGLNLRERAEFMREFNQAESQHRVEQQLEKFEDQLDSQYERGLISDKQYEERLAQQREQLYTQNGGAGNIFTVNEAKKDLAAAEASLNKALRAGEISRDERDEILEQVREDLYENAGNRMSREELRLVRASAQDWAHGDFTDVGTNTVQVYTDLNMVMQQQQLAPQEMQMRQQNLQVFQKGNQALNGEQLKQLLDYAKNGDKPIEADKGTTPRSNPVLGDAKFADPPQVASLSKSILANLMRDVRLLQATLPPEARVSGAQGLVDRMKEKGEDAALVSNLQAALIDRDARRFERNALALKIQEAEVNRFLIGIGLESLRDKLEDGAPADQVRAVCDPLTRWIDGAEIKGEVADSFRKWLQSVPDLLKLRLELESTTALVAGKTPAWPTGLAQIVYVPDTPAGEARLLPNGALLANSGGDARVSLGAGSCYAAHGLPVFDLPADETPAAPVAAKAADLEKPTLMLSNPKEGGQNLSYNITCFKKFRPPLAPLQQWTQEYKIGPGQAQKLPLNWDGSLYFVITCKPGKAGGPTRKYTLAPASGFSPTYVFNMAKDGAVNIYTKPGIATIDNSLNSRPFKFLVGNEHHSVRAGGQSTFDSGVTIRYALDGSTDKCQSWTIREGESGQVGLMPSGQWAVKSGAKYTIASRNSFKLDLGDLKLADLPKQDLPPPVTPAQTPAKGRLYVVSIGVSNYREMKSFPKLQFAQIDAQALTDVLKQQTDLFKEVVHEVLTNEKATALQVRMQLRNLKQKVTKNDVVALVLAGHGLMDKGTYYFCPHDAKLKDLRNTGISCQELQKITSDLTAASVFVMLDSCYSGGITKQFAAAGFNKQIERYGQSGVVVFAATKDSDASQESPEWGHGALTKAFLDTIEDTQSDSNRDSLLQVAELDTGLTERVKQLTQGGQTMQLAEFGDAIRNTALLKFKTRATKAIE